MDLDQIRTHMIAALFSDDELMERLVLKGGNALSLVHKLSQRATVDIDFSMEEEFPSDFDPKQKIEATLNKYFNKFGFTILDLKFSHKPSVRKEGTPDWWGGYLLNFKMIETDNKKLPLEDQRRSSVILGPNNKRNYKIDISYNEYCKGKEIVEVNDIIAYVYSLEMIVIEKLRAICQQMPEYEPISNPRGRARDFYDIYTVLNQHEIDLSDKKHVFEAIFGAKKVPIEWLWQVENVKAFHEESWAGVEISINNDQKMNYDTCFSFVCEVLKELKISWDM